MYDAPQPWTPPDGEPLEITDLRLQHAQEEREWLQRYVNDPTVLTVDLMSTFSHISYDNAKKLAKRSLELMPCYCEGAGWCIHCKNKEKNE